MRHLVAALVWTICAASAQADPLRGWGDVQFGMSADEVIAASPDKRWRREDFGEAQFSRLDGPTVRLGGVVFAEMVMVRFDRVERIVFSAHGRVENREHCLNFVGSVLNDLEPVIGIFGGPPALSEFGVPEPSRTNERGSVLRIYEYPQEAQQRAHANWRGEGFADVQSVSEPIDGEPNALGCAVEIELHERPMPVFAALDRPTRTALAAAAPLEAPEWSYTPMAQDYEMSMPDITHSVQTTIELDCLVIAEGRLNCVIAPNQIDDWYARFMALNLSRFFQLAPSQRDEGLGRRVALPMPLNIGVPLPTGSLESAESDEPLPPPPSAEELSAAPLIEHPAWDERPGVEDFSRYYPREALMAGVNGQVVMDCLVAPDHSLRCAVVEETPTDRGFGDAGLRIANAFHILPEIDGQPTAGGRIRVTIPFRVQ
jgi:hypothetical protein